MFNSKLFSEPCSDRSIIINVKLCKFTLYSLFALKILRILCDLITEKSQFNKSHIFTMFGVNKIGEHQNT